MEIQNSVSKSDISAHHGGDYGALETMSMPGTPLGLRRGQAPGDLKPGLGGGQETRGGSLERNKRKAEARGVSEAYSDTEYVQVKIINSKITEEALISLFSIASRSFNLT